MAGRLLFVEMAAETVPDPSAQVAVDGLVLQQATLSGE